MVIESEKKSMGNRIDGIGHKPDKERMEVPVIGLFSARNIIIPPVCYNKKRMGYALEVVRMATGE